ncbi:MAG: hypothetical protein ACTSQE_00930 [Candidatus Heimdallarchaeaceae archaeon]
MNFFEYIKYLDRHQTLGLISKSKQNEQLSDEDINFQLKQLLTQQELSLSQKRKLWQYSMQGLFLKEMQRCFLFTPTKKYLQTNVLKNAILKVLKTLEQELETEISPIYVSKLNNDPLQFLVAIALKKVQNFEDFLDIPLEEQFILYVFPEIGFLTYWPLEKDLRLKVVLNLLDKLFNNVKEVRINALLLRKFSTNERMQKLVISTPPEIAGFSGLDTIEFKGSDVMLGLSGLKRRHDTEVEKITKVGPLTDIESENLRMKAGKGVQFKNYAAINKFLKVVKS